MIDAVIQHLQEKIKEERLQLGSKEVKYVTAYPAKAVPLLSHESETLFNAIFNKLTDNGSVSDLVLDLGGLNWVGSEYMDPINIQMIVALDTYFRKIEGTLKIVIPREREYTRRKFKTTALDRMLDIYSSKEEALASYK